jgi:proteic killer suppression protein
VGVNLVSCIVTRYTHQVIVSFSHKGLQALYERDSIKGVPPAHAPKLRRVLSVLDVAAGPRDLDLPGFRTHPLSGEVAEHESVGERQLARDLPIHRW